MDKNKKESILKHPFLLCLVSGLFAIIAAVIGVRCSIEKKVLPKVRYSFENSDISNNSGIGAAFPGSQEIEVKMKNTRVNNNDGVGIDFKN